MKLNPGSIAILFSTALFAFCSCDEGGGKKSHGDAPVAPEDPVYIVVNDLSGEPIDGAIVGGALYAYSGIAMGETFIRDSGWLAVDAMGYVPADIKPLQYYNGYALGETRLTRVQQMVLLDSGDTGILECVDDGGAALISAEVNASDFMVKPVAVSAAWIYPDDLEAGMAPLNGENPDLIGAFALYAHDESLASVGLASGKELSVKVSKLAVGNPVSAPELADFDAADGVWEIIPDACNNDPQDESFYSCDIPELSNAFGLFSSESGPQPGYIPAVPEDASMREGATSINRALAAAGVEDDYYQANKAYNERLNEVNEQGLDPTTDTELIQDCNALSDAAVNYATANPGFTAVQRTLTAVEAALTTGQDDLAQDLSEQATSMVEDLVSEALAESGSCESIHELLILMQNLILVAGSEEVENQLREKIESIMENCRKWTGNIMITMPPDQTHPALDQMTLDYHGNIWGEKHTIRMFMDPETYEIEGEDHVNLGDFLIGTVHYSEKDNPCECSVEYNPNSGFITNVFVFSGSWDGYKPTLGPLAAGMVTPVPANIVEIYTMQYENDEEQCENAQGYPMTLPFTYYSIMVHGIGSAEPVITLQELVDKGGWRKIDVGTGGLVCSGFIFLDNPGVDTGIIPSSRISVSWYFQLVPFRF
ncbi:MAG TPA: hypothetical protein P5346_12270 [Spirochaetota bacterium]|nr:hypothetical protein [Spirochaetota bacterium]